MPIFKLRLEPTYYSRSFFNVRVGFDDNVRPTPGPITLLLGKNNQHIAGHVDRSANRNRTARIFGRAPLKEWFQTHFALYDIVDVDFLSFDIIRLREPAGSC